MSNTLFNVISSSKIKRAAKLDLRKFAARSVNIIFFICKKVKRRSAGGVHDPPGFRMAGRMLDCRTPARLLSAFRGAIRRFSRSSPIFVRLTGSFAKNCSAILHERDDDAWLQPLHELPGGPTLRTMPNCPGYSHIIAYYLSFLYACSGKKARLLL